MQLQAGSIWTNVKENVWDRWLVSPKLHQSVFTSDLRLFYATEYGVLLSLLPPRIPSTYSSRNNIPDFFMYLYIYSIELYTKYYVSVLQLEMAGNTASTSYDWCSPWRKKRSHIFGRCSTTLRCSSWTCRWCLDICLYTKYLYTPKKCRRAWFAVLVARGGAEGSRKSPSLSGPLKKRQVFQRVMRRWSRILGGKACNAT